MPVMDYFPVFIRRQFKTLECSDFPGVLIPLESAQRHHSVVSKAEKDADNISNHSPDSSDAEKGEKDLSRRRFSVGYDVHTIEGMKAEIEADLQAFGVNSTYDKKAKVINKAIQDMGMGRYQYALFVLCGFGWFADNFWLQGVALTLTQLTKEFGVRSAAWTRWTTFSLFIGLTFGAAFWGIASDVIGRRLAFNVTLFLGGVFGIAAGGAPTYAGVNALFACVGLGVGGNLPVDGALFLEFLPFASGNMLTLLSIWWPVGSLVASMIAWGFIPNYPTDEGWRYFIFTLGAITLSMWVCRFILFQLFESPKFLLSKGRQAEAVAVVHGIAYVNKQKTWLTEEILNEIGGYPETVGDTKLSMGEVIKRNLNKFSGERVGPLFANWKLGLTTGLLWLQWTTIGMGYPLFNGFLPQYLAQNGAGGSESTYLEYRNYAITTVVGVPGSALAYYTVDLKYIGRKGTMATATLLTGIFLFIFTASTDSNFQLAFSCLVNFTQNIMYGVLYAYTPEVFPAPNRGTGTGISSTMNRIGGFCAPLVGIFAAQTNAKAPIYASGALILVAFLSMCGLPLETRGKQSL